MPITVQFLFFAAMALIHPLLALFVFFIFLFVCLEALGGS